MRLTWVTLLALNALALVCAASVMDTCKSMTSQSAPGEHCEERLDRRTPTSGLPSLVKFLDDDGNPAIQTLNDADHGIPSLAIAPEANSLREHVSTELTLEPPAFKNQQGVDAPRFRSDTRNLLVVPRGTPVQPTRPDARYGHLSVMQDGAKKPTFDVPAKSQMGSPAGAFEPYRRGGSSQSNTLSLVGADATPSASSSSRQGMQVRKHNGKSAQNSVGSVPFDALASKQPPINPTDSASGLHSESSSTQTQSRPEHAAVVGDKSGPSTAHDAPEASTTVPQSKRERDREYGRRYRERLRLKIAQLRQIVDDRHLPIEARQKAHLELNRIRMPKLKRERDRYWGKDHILLQDKSRDRMRKLRSEEQQKPEQPAA